MKMMFGNLAGAALLFCLPQAGGAGDTSSYEVDTEFLTEASGVAVSRRNPDLLWTHNDSGDFPTLYALNTRGHYRGALDVLDAQAFDWEDIAAFTLDGEPWLLIADVGDNLGVRPFVSLYLLPEPDISDAGENFSIEASASRRIDLRYPEGARDVEGVAVDATRGDIYLISKRQNPPELYRAPLAANEDAQPLTAERVATVAGLPHSTDEDRRQDPKFGQFRHQPTALDISVDGKTWLVTTYKQALLYTRGDAQTPQQLFDVGPQVFNLPRLSQLESGALSADASMGYFVSEHVPAQLVVFPFGEQVQDDD